jgi:four helix bundle protein
MRSTGEVKSYRDLLVWQRAVDLAVMLYELSNQLPKSETYGLTSQIRRSAVSIAANIAEGHARDTTRDYLRFLSIAVGSLSELETHLILCERLRYLSAVTVRPAMEAADELGKMLRSMRGTLSNRIASARESEVSYDLP